MLGLSALPDFGWGEGDDEMMGGAYSDVIDRFATLESGGGKLRSNPMSSARGLLHFLPSTWAGVLRNYPDLGFAPADIDDDAKQRKAAEVLMEREIVPSLRRTLGREPTGAEIYTAWGLGAPDAGKLFQADPNAPAASLFRPKVASSNPSIFYRDPEGTVPRTAAEVAAEYARRFNGAKPTKEAPPMQPEYDVDQGIANMNDMAQRVGQMRPGLSALGPQQQPQGLSALSPYLQLARQLSPSRESNWGDALINAGAAMMQSTRPDFLGGLGAGLQAGNSTLSQGREQMRGDGLKQFSLAMDLAKFDQKDNKPIALAEGGMLVTPDGRTVAANPKAGDKAPITKEFKEGDRIVTKQWNGAMWVPMAEAPANAPPAGFTRGPDGSLVADPGYLAAQEQIRRAGAPNVSVDTKGQTAGAQEGAKLDAKKLDGFRSQADVAASTVDDINVVESWLDGLDTGSLAPEKLAAQKFLGGIGINLNIFGSQEQVGKAEAATTIVNQMALKLRNPDSGLGMPGALSDNDLRFLKQSTVGLETTPEGRKLIIDLTRRAANRRMEVARLADEFYYKNENSFKGWSDHLKTWREANPLFSDADLAAAKAAAAAPKSPGAASRSAAPGLPPSDADVRRQNTPPGSPSGGIIPGPKRFDLGGAKAAPQPPQTAPAAAKPINQMSARELADLVRSNPNDPDVLKQVDDRIKALGY